MNQNPPFPTPEELQAKLSEFMKSNFGDKVSFTSFAQPEQAEAGDDEKPTKASGEEFVFRFLPRDIKAHLDRFVIKQEEAKKVLSIAVCDHYNHVNYLRQLERDASAPKKEYGSRTSFRRTDGGRENAFDQTYRGFDQVPFVKADATKFSETGYVGGDVEDLVRELVQKADGDVALAQFGIIYIDEVDKLASASNMVGRDVSGRGVQTTLLKLMEETEVPLRSANDMQGQLQAAFEFKKRAKPNAKRLQHPPYPLCCPRRLRTAQDAGLTPSRAGADRLSNGAAQGPRQRRL
jgi:hypothetical protein